jgi:hypothetical protein
LRASPRREEKYWYAFRVVVEKDPKNIVKLVEAPGIEAERCV